MKHIRLSLVLAILLFSARIASALTLPVDADSFTTPANTVTIPTGRAASIPLSSKQNALFFFDLTELPASYNPNTVVSARLKLYVSRVIKAGDLQLRAATEIWSETTPGAAPAFGSDVLAAIQAAKLANRKFITLDVTEMVQSWLAQDPQNLGFVLIASPAAPLARIVLGSKEGPSLGFPAELELEIGTSVNNNDQGTSSAIGGGAGNSIAFGTNAATIPGGSFNAIGAGADFSFAAGRRAKAVNKGSFVWADSTNSDFTSTADDQFSIRAANGVVIANDAGNAATVPVGTRYRDNSIVAWGRVTANGTLDSNFNVASITKVGTGHYKVNLATSLLSGFSLIPVVTPETDEAAGNVPQTGAANVRFATTNQFAAGTNFDVYMFNGSFNSVDNDFQFIVTGR